MVQEDEAVTEGDRSMVEEGAISKEQEVLLSAILHAILENMILLHIGKTS